MIIERVRGDTGPDICTVMIEDEPANITGCSFIMTVDSSPYPVNTSTQLYQLTGEIADAENGIVHFRPDGYQASRIGHYYYNVKIVDVNGDLSTIISGRYVFKHA